MVQARCRNCGAGLHGRYCHLCGQDVFAGARRSVWSIVFNMLGNVFSLDNKVLITLTNLICRPGKLTREYVEGHLVRYVEPGKLFWFVSILFFATVLSQMNFDDHPKNIPDEAKQYVPEMVQKDTDEVSLLKRKLDNEKVKAVISTYAPYLAFVMIPYFALIIMLFFHRRGKGLFYVDHLVFAFHFHTFVFLLWSVCIWISKAFPSFGDNFESGGLIIIPTLYLFIALYVFYRPRKRSLLLKFPLMSLFYLVGLVTVIICLAVLLFQIKKLI